MCSIASPLLNDKIGLLGGLLATDFSITHKHKGLKTLFGMLFIIVAALNSQGHIKTNKESFLGFSESRVSG